MGNDNSRIVLYKHGRKAKHVQRVRPRTTGSNYTVYPNGHEHTTHGTQYGSVEGMLRGKGRAIEHVYTYEPGGIVAPLRDCQLHYNCTQRENGQPAPHGANKKFFRLASEAQTERIRAAIEASRLASLELQAAIDDAWKGAKKIEDHNARECFESSELVGRTV